jgi:hypothetical protein
LLISHHPLYLIISHPLSPTISTSSFPLSPPSPVADLAAAVQHLQRQLAASTDALNARDKEALSGT